MSATTRRIVTEVVVIVGSILLAFSLDAWWDRRQESERVGALLEAVADEFDREIAGLDSIIAVNRRVEAASRDLVDLVESTPGPADPDSVASMTARGGSYEIYDPSFGALAALLSTGALERVTDSDLRGRLAGWTGELVDLEWERGQVFDANDGVLEALEERGAMSAVRGLDGWWRARVDAILTSPSHRQRDSRLTLVLSLYTDDLVRIRRRADEVRGAIRGYLEGGT